MESDRRYHSLLPVLFTFLACSILIVSCKPGHKKAEASAANQQQNEARAQRIAESGENRFMDTSACVASGRYGQAACELAEKQSKSKLVHVTRKWLFARENCLLVSSECRSGILADHPSVQGPTHHGFLIEAVDGNEDFIVAEPLIVRGAEIIPLASAMKVVMPTLVKKLGYKENTSYRLPMTLSHSEAFSHSAVGNQHALFDYTESFIAKWPPANPYAKSGCAYPDDRKRGLMVAPSAPKAHK